MHPYCTQILLQQGCPADKTVCLPSRRTGHALLVLPVRQPNRRIGSGTSTESAFSSQVDYFGVVRDSGAIPKGVAETAVAGSLRRVSDASHDFGAHPIESLAPYLSPLHCAESETLDGSPSPFFKGSSMSARTPLGLDRSVRGYPLERNGFPSQSLRSDCARSGKTHAVGPLISHLVLH